MTKLHTTDEITSPFFPQEFADYLIASGYQLRVVNDQSQSYAFEKDRFYCLQIIRDWVHLLIWNEEEDDRLADWSSVHQFEGISHLDFFKFALLLHTIGAVSIKDNYRKTNANPSLFETLCSQFKPAFV